MLRSATAAPGLPAATGRRPAGPRPTFYEIRPAVRAVTSEDGAILLDVESGKYFALNAVGARVWCGIGNGRSAEEVLEELEATFDAPRERIRTDVARILAQLEADQLIAARAQRPSDVARGGRGAARGEAEEEGQAATAAVRSIVGSEHRELPAPHVGADLLWFVLGFLTLVYLDLLTRVGRFPALYNAIARARSRARRASPQRLWRITRAVDRAASFYFRQTWCLQRSATCVYLLRRNGFPARLVLGVQVLPFMAHAWAEVDGQVVNDNRDEVGRLAVLDRI